MTVLNDQALVQSADEMFVRNCGHLAKRSREVRVHIEGLPSRVGFLSGLDEEFIQICLTANQTLSNIRRDFIMAIEETGMGLSEYEQSLTSVTGSPTKTLNLDAIERIRDRVGHFQRRAASVYGR